MDNTTEPIAKEKHEKKRKHIEEEKKNMTYDRCKPKAIHLLFIFIISYKMKLMLR
jgi:hypothetical protein